MQRWMGSFLTVAVFFLPALLLAGVGRYVGNWNTAITFSVPWVLLLFTVSVQFRRKHTYAVVERFGYFWDVQFAGWCLVIPFIDSIAGEGDFKQQQVPLFLRKKGEASERIEIDFKDASAPVDADAWYQIGNPEALVRGDLQAVREDVVRYTYRVNEDERASRIADIFQGSFRASLEARVLEEAQKGMDGIVKETAEAVREPLREIGVYPFPGRSIIVRDIDLPEAVVKLREQALRGEMDAREANRRHESFIAPVKAMKKGLCEGEGCMTLSDKEVTELYLNQKALETVEKTGANITFIAPGMHGVLESLNVGSKH